MGSCDALGHCLGAVTGLQAMASCLLPARVLQATAAGSHAVRMMYQNWLELVGWVTRLVVTGGAAAHMVRPMHHLVWVWVTCHLCHPR